MFLRQLKDGPVNLEDNAARFFDSFAETFDSLYDGRRNFCLRWLDHRFRSDMFVRFALTFKSLGDLSGKTVLDIGCGSGPYIVEALKRDASWVTGVDPALNMLALAQNKLRLAGLSQRCSLVEGLFPEVILKVHDHAIVMGVMDYVENPKNF